MGMLQNLGASVKGRLGLDGPSEEELAAIRKKAQQDEFRRLDVERKVKRREAKFLQTVGEGKRRDVNLSFGNTDDLDEESEDLQSRRATGRFKEARLVL